MDIFSYSHIPLPGASLTPCSGREWLRRVFQAALALSPASYSSFVPSQETFGPSTLQSHCQQAQSQSDEKTTSPFMPPQNGHGFNSSLISSLHLWAWGFEGLAYFPQIAT